jgi:acyl-coenzyme A synthetase/AMP-(fatty) acid ligase
MLPTLYERHRWKAGESHTTADDRRYATSKWVFDLKEDDVFWCTADAAG